MKYCGLRGRENAGGIREGWEACCGFRDIDLHVVNFQQELFFGVVVADSSTFSCQKASCYTEHSLNACAGGKGGILT